MKRKTKLFEKHFFDIYYFLHFFYLWRMSTRLPSSGIIELSTIPVFLKRVKTILMLRNVWYNNQWTLLITYCEAQAGHRNNQLVRFCCTGDLWESVLSLGWCWSGVESEYWGGPSKSVWDCRPHSLTQGGCEAGIHHSQVEWVSETRIH